MKENPYQTPDSRLDIEQTNQEHTLAPLSARFIAALLDGIVSIIILLPFIYIGYLFETETPFWKDFPLFENALFLSIFMIFYMIGTHVLFHGVLLAKYGQTIGKRIVGIQIVDYDSAKILPLLDVIGKRYSPQVLVNYVPLVGSFLSLIDILFIFGRERRCVHDLIANTKVIEYLKPRVNTENESRLI